MRFPILRWLYSLARSSDKRLAQIHRQREPGRSAATDKLARPTAPAELGRSSSIAGCPAAKLTDCLDRPQPTAALSVPPLTATLPVRPANAPAPNRPAPP